MRAYSVQFKTDLINKYLNSNNITITEFARNNNINYVTFKKWLDAYENDEKTSDFKEAMIEEPKEQTITNITLNLHTMEMKLTMDQAIKLIKLYGRM